MAESARTGRPTRARFALSCARMGGVNGQSAAVRRPFASCCGYSLSQAISEELADRAAGYGDPALGRGRGQVVIAGRAGLAPAGRTGGQRGDNGIEGVV